MIASDVQPHLDGIFVESLTTIAVVSCYEWAFTEDIDSIPSTRYRLMSINPMGMLYDE